MEYKKVGNVRLTSGGGKVGPVQLNGKGTCVKVGSQLGSDARKGLDIKPARVR